MDACAPVLFLVFNRPEQTRRVFEAIRAARPHRLYVAADGPRPDRPGESERCAEVRTIATAVDWPCELQTRFHDHNLGCRDAPASSISWFFQAEPQGIVLEDDCLPSPEFFDYATALLDYYADDTRVMKINGFNPFGSYPSPGSYFYSYFGFAWGWASWRRVWRYFDADVTVLSNQLSSLNLLSYPFYKGRLRIIEDLKSGLDAWDFQLEFAISAQHGLQVIPSKSMVCNIGFGSEASHTQKLPRGIKNLSHFSTIFPIVHPTLMMPDAGYERRLLDLDKPSPWARVKLVIKSLLRVYFNLK